MVTGQLADVTRDFACLVFVLLAASARPRVVQSATCPVREMPSPRVGICASCPVTVTMPLILRLVRRRLRLTDGVLIYNDNGRRITILKIYYALNLSNM